MRAGESREGGGCRTCPAAEGAVGEIRDSGDCERAAEDRDQDRGDIADAQQIIEKADQEREAGRGVGDGG